MSTDQNPYEHETNLGESNVQKASPGTINRSPINGCFLAWFLTLLLVCIWASCNPIIRHRQSGSESKQLNKRYPTPSNRWT